MVYPYKKRKIVPAFGYGSRSSGKGYTRKVGYYGRYPAKHARKSWKYGGGTIHPGNELKYFDTGAQLTATTDFVDAGAESGVFFVATVGSGGSGRSLNLINSGSSQFNRIGVKVWIRSVHLRIKWEQEGNQRSATDFSSMTNWDKTTNNMMWIWVVLDRQANGANATFGDVFQDPTASSTTVAAALPQWYRNIERVSRFKILHKGCYPMIRANSDAVWNGTNVIAAMWDQAQIPIELDIPVNEIVEYQDADGSDTTMNKVCCNNITVFVGGNYESSTPRAIKADINARTRFYG